MAEKVLITYVKDGERTPSFIVVDIEKIVDVYRIVKVQTTTPITISPIVEYE